MKHITGWLLRQQGGLCALCFEVIGRRQESLDHIIPKSLGGPTLLSNLQATHKTCNALRGATASCCLECKRRLPDDRARGIHKHTMPAVRVMERR